MQKTLRICVEFNLPQCTDGGNAGGEGSSAYNGRCKTKGEEGLSQLSQLLRGQPPLDAVDILLIGSPKIRGWFSVKFSLPEASSCRSFLCSKWQPCPSMHCIRLTLSFTLDFSPPIPHPVPQALAV